MFGEDPMVSVVIPCYNAYEYIGEAIESAIFQSYENIEVVVIDDGSTDQSLKKIRSYSDKVEILSTNNYGPSHARNKGIEVSNGKLIKFLDADDVLRNHTISKQVKETKYISDSRGIVYSDIGRMEADGTGRSPRSLKYRPQKAEETNVQFLLENNINTQCPLHKKKFLLEVDGFDEDFMHAEDYDLNLKLGMSGVNFHFWPGISGFLRQHKSPDRIANMSRLDSEPDVLRKQLRIRYKRLKDYFGESPPSTFRKNISQKAWNRGRKLIKIGNNKEASKYFVLSKRIFDLPPPKSNMIYRCLVFLVGPVAAEKIVHLVKQ